MYRTSGARASRRDGIFRIDAVWNRLRIRTSIAAMTLQYRDRPKNVLRRDSIAVLSGALGLLTCVTLVRWGRWLFSPVPLFDEAIYVEAFRAVASGGSPYTIDGYYYPPMCAIVGAWLLSALGEVPLLAVARTLMVVGLVATVWLSLIWWPVPARLRLLVGALYVSLAPAVGLGLRTGNLSFLVIGATVVSLTLWLRRPVASGLLLGSSVSIKPIAPVAILVLLSHRAVTGRAKKLLAGGLASILMMVSVLPLREAASMLSQNINRLSYHRSLSLHRLSQLAGFDLHPVAAFAVVALIASVISRSRALDRAELLCVALPAAVCALPLIWTHTLLLTLPVQVLALTRAADRRSWTRRATGDRSKPHLRYELWVVLLLVAAIQLAEGSGAVDRAAAWFQLAALGLPFVAPALLGGYVLMTSPRVEGSLAP